MALAVLVVEILVFLVFLEVADEIGHYNPIAGAAVSVVAFAAYVVGVAFAVSLA